MAKKWNIPFLGSPALKPQIIENKLVQMYKEIKPYSVDPDTGEVLNPTSEPILVKSGTRDLQEEIESYTDSSLASVLAKVSLYNDTITGLEPEFNVKSGSYGVDITDLPDNINDVSDYLKQEKNIITPQEAVAPVTAQSRDIATEKEEGKKVGVDDGKEKK